ncbi:hypothetical protein ACHAQH_007892 [Verticillium albo-atrum]
MPARLGFGLDAVRILGSTRLRGGRDTDKQRFEEWCMELMSWLVRTSVGKSALDAFNNHAICTHLTAISLSMFSSNNSLANQLPRNITHRIDGGFTTNGSQPHELIRTQPFHFAAERGSKMALDALTGGKLETPSLGGGWPIRPATQEPEASEVRPGDE